MSSGDMAPPFLTFLFGSSNFQLKIPFDIFKEVIYIDRYFGKHRTVITPKVTAHIP
jgi:hypothetical protein